jgi:putative phosphoesterase
MKKIGILSDTHGFLDKRIFHYFKDVDEIWHAGDIGNIEIIDQLNNFKPLRAVYGNIDGNDVRLSVPCFNKFKIENVNVLITHIAGRPYKYSKSVYDELIKNSPDLLICGHSHILLVQFDKKFNMLWMNPGACGNKGIHKVKTLLRFSITDNKIHNLEVIEIEKRF